MQTTEYRYMPHSMETVQLPAYTWMHMISIVTIKYR